VFDLASAGPDEFSYFDFRAGKNVAIQFQAANDGHASAMVLRLAPAEMRIPAVSR
jgi:hypothetical protein